MTSTGVSLRLLVRADLANDVEAAEAGEHHVEQHDVGPQLPRQLHRLLAAHGARHVEFVCERGAEKLAQGAVVLDDENRRAGGLLAVFLYGAQVRHTERLDS